MDNKKSNIDNKLFIDDTSTGSDNAGTKLSRYEELKDDLRIQNQKKEVNDKEDIADKQFDNKSLSNKQIIYKTKRFGATFVADEKKTVKKEETLDIKNKEVDKKTQEETLTKKIDSKKEIEDSIEKVEKAKKVEKITLNNIQVEEKKKDIDSKAEVKIDKEIKKEKVNNVLEQENKTTLKNKASKSQSRCIGIIKRKDISNLTDKEKTKRLEELQKKILLELDTKLKREIAELDEVRQENNKIVELLNNEMITSEEVEEEVKRLEELLKKVTKLIEQVKILNDNYKFEDILNITDFQDQNIVNDIIEFRDILDTSDHAEKLTEKYKMLDNFIVLYREVYIKNNVIKKNKEKASSKLKDTKDKEKKYLKFGEDADNIKKINDDCKIIIDKQNEYLAVLQRRINNIDASRVMEYRVMGTDNILRSMLMYMGIMMAMPFKNKKNKNIMSSVIVGNMLRNLNRPRGEFREKTKYDAIDLSDEIYNHLGEVEIVATIIDSTLDDIIRMKEEFSRNYKGKVPGYEEVESKLQEIELNILNNKKQIEKEFNSLSESIMVNDRKLVKVKELNHNLA